VKKMNDDEIYLFNYVVRTIPKFLGWTTFQLGRLCAKQIRANLQFDNREKGQDFPNNFK
jgi:hypothetical protein